MIQRHDRRGDIEHCRFYTIVHMKIKFVIGITFIVAMMSLGSKSEAYLFGMKSWDNTIDNIQRIEEEYHLDLPIVSFIFDPRGEHVEQMMSGFNKEL